jgi:PII-like signaling protein
MKEADITMVRIYITEAEHRLHPLLNYLHDQAHMRGVTVFRGIGGFGKSGQMHSAGLVDLSLDLPLVIEFFDDPAKVASALDHLNGLVEIQHLVTWPAKVNV